MGHLNQARECILRALAMLEENNEQSTELVHALTELAIIEKDQQNLVSARAHIEHALAMLHHHDAPRQRGSALVVQALIAELQNKITEALRLYDKALVAYRQAEDRENEAQVLYNMGVLYDHYYKPTKETLKKALAYYQQSLEINTEISALQGMADNLSAIAAIYQVRGDAELARKMHKQALQVYEGAKFLEGEIEVLTNLGVLERDERHFDAATQYLTSVVQKALEVDNPRLIAEAYRNRGDIALASEQLQAAIDDYMRVVEVTESMRALLQEDEALGYFTDERLKAYSNLVRLFVRMPEKSTLAFTYMERVKSREFLRRLSVSALPEPQSVPKALLEQESHLLVQLRQLVAELAAPTTTDRHIVVSNYQAAEKQLHGVWAEIEKYNPEYRDLRHGEPVPWQELKDILTFA
jgi:tetratricopeptide (TPR) repeat protein